MNPFEGIKPEGQVQTGIEIDPEVLKKIQSMRRMHSPPEDFHRRTTSFAASVTEPFVNNFFLNCLRRMGIEEFKKRVFEHRDALNKGAYKKIPDEVEDIDYWILRYKLSDAMLGIRPRGHSAMSNMIEGKNEKFFNDFISGEETKTEEGKSETVQLLEEELKGKTVVDLGSGDDYFRYTASLCKAKEYVGIDLPFDEKDYGTEQEISRMRRNADLIFPEYRQCKARQIQMDILEALYTKIPDNSSCFVIFGVDETYELGRDYIDLTNEMIVKKTEVGGIVACFNSVIGINLEKNDNFEVIYDSGWTTKIYKRVK